MRVLVVVLIGVVALASGAMLGYKLNDDSESAEAATALPAAVEETRAALLEAAEAGDYEALRPLIPEQFEYTFGDPVDGGPIAYWQELERTTDQRPLEALVAILKMPSVLVRGFYYWPWAHIVTRSEDLSPHEQELLAPLGTPSELFPEGSGYFGWRTAIAPDGKWVFFVAGD